MSSGNVYVVWLPGWISFVCFRMIDPQLATSRSQQEVEHLLDAGQRALASKAGLELGIVQRFVVQVETLFRDLL